MRETFLFSFICVLCADTTLLAIAEKTRAWEVPHGELHPSRSVLHGCFLRTLSCSPEINFLWKIYFISFKLLAIFHLLLVTLWLKLLLILEICCFRLKFAIFEYVVFLKYEFKLLYKHNDLRSLFNWTFKIF